MRRFKGRSLGMKVEMANVLLKFGHTDVQAGEQQDN